MSKDEQQMEGVSYSRVLCVERAVSAQADRDALMKILEQRAADMTVFEKNPVYFFSGQASSSKYDSYETRMMPSTLQNYANEAAAGVAFMRRHDTYGTDPIGQTLTGQIIGGQGNGVSRVTTDWFVMRDEDSATFVDRMLAGAIRSLSVGFYGGRWMCSICGKDMEQWMLRDGCHHFLGMMYQPRDESGAPTGEAVMCRADIEDAHLAELSGVFKNSTPDCMISKARAMAADGLLRGSERELVEVRYALALPAYAKPFQGVDAPDPGARSAVGNNTQEDEDMADENEAKMIRIADNRLMTLEEVTRAVQVNDATRAALDASEIAKGKEPAEGIVALTAEITRLRAIEESVATIRSQAEDGKKYRAALITEAIKQGVRAHGDKFDETKQRAMLEKSDLETIESFRDSWRAIGDTQFKGGRQVEEEDDAPPPARSETPSAAYRAS